MYYDIFDFFPYAFLHCRNVFGRLVMTFYIGTYLEISCWKDLFQFEFRLENLKKICLFWFPGWRHLTTKSSTTKCQNESPKINQELWASANKLWVSIIIKIVHKPPKKKKHVKKHIWKKFGVIILHNDFPKQFVGAFI